jgi:hypothetical protein
LVFGAALAGLVAITTNASAHVTVGIPTLEVTALTYRIPVEPAPTTPEELAKHHTQKVTVTLPAGLKVEQCPTNADFSCKVGVETITWTRRANSTNYQLVDFLAVSVRTPGVGGTYRTPAVQVYSDGEEVSWSEPNTTDPHPAPQLRVNGPDRAPAVATGIFKPLSELGAGNPCPQEVVDEATRLGMDPAVHCGHFGFGPPAPAAGAPAPPAGSPAPPVAAPAPAPAPPAAEELDIRGTAKVVRSAGQTLVEITVTGLQPGVVYSAHLHEGTCGNPTSAHYKNDLTGPDAPPNELWPSSDPADPTAGLIADSKGVAKGSGVADWVARPTARAIWIHEPEDPTAPPGSHVHARIGCADLG